jgi:hypothetical protein
MKTGLLGLLLTASLVVAPFMGASQDAEGATAHPTAASCPVYKQHKVAYSLGILESLLPDNHGGMLLSASTGNAVERLTPNGHVTVLAKLPSPGELVWHGPDTVMFSTGDALASGALGRADGTLSTLNLKTRKLTTVASGLTMPNGLAVSHGSAYVTRDLGGGTGITRISLGRKPKVMTNWSTIADTNGIAIDAKRGVMYVDQTFTVGGPVDRIPMATPNATTQIADLSQVDGSPVQLLDDLTMANGILYVPGNGGGDLYSFDPLSSKSCLIATGLGNPSDVTVGTGHGWRKGALFVCGFDGTVREFVRQS